MVNFRISLCSVAVAGVFLAGPNIVLADGIKEALENGTASGNFRLRYESVDQDNVIDNASAVTLRTRLGYATGEIEGFSAFVEFEDSRVVGGQDDYNNTLGKGVEYSVIADPEVTEVDQGYLKYQNKGITLKFGRQVITTDNQRFIGHVGWRQDRQTFDAATLNYSPFDKVSLMYGYINKRNRIFGEDKDVHSSDHIFNASFKAELATLSGYHYQLEEDNKKDNSLDTTGIRLTGNLPAGDALLLYTLEYAIQSSESAVTDYDAKYMLLEGGGRLFGITAKLGYEVLGSDGGDYAFSTPLATLHKFNGWADQFLVTPKIGLVDKYITLNRKIGPGKFSLTYHDYEAEEDSGTIDSFGNEINLSYSLTIAKDYKAGIKYATYQKGGDVTGKVDTDKAWVWVGTSF